MKGRRAAVPAVLLIAVIVFSLALAGGVFYFLQKEKAANIALQDELDEIKTRQRMTETRLQDSQKVISTLEEQLQGAKGKMDTLVSDLQMEKKAKEDALVKIEQLRVGLEEQQALRSDLEKKFNLAQRDAQGIQAQLKDLESKRTTLEAKIKELEIQQQSQAVELGKIVVSPEAQPAVASSKVYSSAIQSTKVAPVKKTKQKVTKVAKVEKVSALEGKILVVNKDYNFAVISLGSKDGVVVGNVFSVQHDNKYVGDLKIEKVHDAMAAAGFVSDTIRDKISEGDKVARKNK